VFQDGAQGGDRGVGWRDCPGIRRALPAHRLEDIPGSEPVLAFDRGQQLLLRRVRH